MKGDLTFPKKAIELAEEMDPYTVFPISFSVNKDIFPGLLICCNNDIFDRFRIRENIPNFDLQFRMLHNEEDTYVAEASLKFTKGFNFFSRRKIMRLHLNPVNKIVQYFLDKSWKKEMISFNMANIDTGELITAVSKIDSIEKDWFERNKKLAKKLKHNTKYEELSLTIQNRIMKKNEVRFEFYDTIEKELLVEHTKNTFTIQL